MDCYFSTVHPSSSGSSSSSAPNKGKEKKKGGKKGTNHHGTTHVKLSTDPQSVAARERRHRISDRFKILQSLVPGGTKMDTVSMLEEAINYVKFLKTQILLHQSLMNLEDDNNNNNNNNDPLLSASLFNQLSHDHLSLPCQEYDPCLDTNFLNMGTSVVAPPLPADSTCFFADDQEEVLPYNTFVSN